MPPPAPVTSAIRSSKRPTGARKLAVACLFRQRSVASPSMAHELDLARMRRERVAKIQAEMEREGLDALYLLTSGNVLYAAGGVDARRRQRARRVRAHHHLDRPRRRSPARVHAVPGGRAARAAARPPPRADVARHRGRHRGARAHARRHARRRGCAPARARRLHRADVVRPPQAARAARARERHSAPHRVPVAQDRRRARVHAPLLADQRRRHLRSRAGAPARDPPHRSHRRVLPPVLRAGRYLQLPRPGLADDARAHRRRAVEHEWRRALRARHRRPPPHPRRRRLDRHGFRLRGLRVRRRAHVGGRAAEPTSSAICSRGGRTSSSRSPRRSDPA